MSPMGMQNINKSVSSKHAQQMNAMRPYMARAKIIAIPYDNRTRKSFSREVENLHGRLAMIGITGVSIVERMSGLTFPDQVMTETGFKFEDVAAVVALATTFFILRAANPKNETHEVQDLDVFSSPGFTSGTEILHGRLAMLGFAYIVLAEAVKAHALFTLH